MMLRNQLLRVLAALLFTAAVTFAQTAQPTPKPDLRSTQKPADKAKANQGKSTPAANPVPVSISKGTGFGRALPR